MASFILFLLVIVIVITGLVLYINKTQSSNISKATKSEKDDLSINYSFPFNYCNISIDEFTEREKERYFKYFIQSLDYNFEDSYEEFESFDPDEDHFHNMAIYSAILFVRLKTVSPKILQKEFCIGYNFAGRIIDYLESLGIVGEFYGFNNVRELIVTDEKTLMVIFNNFDSIKVQIDKKRVAVFYNVYKSEIDLIKEKKRLEKIEHQKRKEIDEKELIKEKIKEKEKRKRLQKEAYDELTGQDKILRRTGRKEIISQSVKDKVWNRDAGKCSSCGSKENLEFDHIIPFSKGGASTYRNIQLLCKNCNIKKSNNIG